VLPLVVWQPIRQQRLETLSTGLLRGFPNPPQHDRFRFSINWRPPV
jgi:hypothetical protein